MPQLDAWSDRLRRTLGGDPSRDDIDAFVRDLVSDCQRFIQQEQNIRIPSYELSLCDNEQFQQLLQLCRLRYSHEPIALSAGIGSHRLIAVNVVKVLLMLRNENPHYTVVLNLALAAIEELVHVARPELSEAQVNEMVNNIGERYLGVTIPYEVKEKLARIVAENEGSF